MSGPNSEVEIPFPEPSRSESPVSKGQERTAKPESSRPESPPHTDALPPELKALLTDAAGRLAVLDTFVKECDQLKSADERKQSLNKLAGKLADLSSESLARYVDRLNEELKRSGSRTRVTLAESWFYGSRERSLHWHGTAETSVNFRKPVDQARSEARLPPTLENAIELVVRQKDKLVGSGPPLITNAPPEIKAMLTDVASKLADQSTDSVTRFLERVNKRLMESGTSAC